MTASTTATPAGGTPPTRADITLDRHQTATLDLLMGGWLAPLDRFMGPREAEEWVRTEGHPVPALGLEVVVAAGTVLPGRQVALRDAEGVLLATMDVEGAVKPAGSPSGDLLFVHGPLTMNQPPVHYDHTGLRLTVVQAREAAGTTQALMVPAAFPLTAAGAAHVRDAAGRRSLPIILVSLIGDAPPDDSAAHTVIMAHAMTAARWRRECTAPVVHVVLPLLPPTNGRGHALLARVLRGSFSDALVEPETAALMGDGQTTAHTWPEDLSAGASGPEPVESLDADVADLLRRRGTTAETGGLTVFFTGLSGSGKSTVANAVMARLHAESDRRITLLDGDLVRTHLSSELSFSREHRDLNITRIGFVAAEVSKHGGVAICAPIAPYEATRDQVRRMVQAHGDFILVHVSTPLAVCEARDRKGLYAKARAGEIASFTGISDPYEEPRDADLILDTSVGSVADAADRVMALLRSRGFIPESPSGVTG